MNLTVELSSEVESALAEIASRRGVSSEEVARRFIAQGVMRKPPRPLAEIAAPIAADFSASGMTDADLDALVEEAREEIYFEQNGRRSKQ
jgi:predicted transcriptional regulator